MRSEHPSGLRAAGLIRGDVRSKHMDDMQCGKSNETAGEPLGEARGERWRGGAMREEATPDSTDVRGRGDRTNGEGQLEQARGIHLWRATRSDLSVNGVSSRSITPNSW
mmetsp:Transcript_3642/g.9552  ORF Transcript_3642/g.9552 Transcript_3642/m.9552 type:complete len:109 (-) Transcript_3642:649-975(-)